MPISTFLLLISCVTGLAVGNILLKKTASTLQNIPADIYGLIANPWFYSAIIIYAGSTFFWILILRKASLSLSYPIFALGFLIVPLLDHFFFKEPLRTNTFIGGFIIIIGVAVATRGT